jgi:hypothetical protein
MKTAKPADWKTEALPPKKTTIHLARTFSLQEMEHIRRGLVPEQMGANDSFTGRMTPCSFIVVGQDFVSTLSILPRG